MTTEHQPGSQVDIDELEREGHEWDHGQLLRAARSLCAELRTLRARVGELEAENARLTEERKAFEIQACNDETEEECIQAALGFIVEAREGRARIAALESQLAAARSNSAQLSEELRSVGEELARLREERTRLREQISQAQRRFRESWPDGCAPQCANSRSRSRLSEQHGIERLRAAADDLRGSLAVSDHDPYEELAPDDKHCLICEAGARYDTATSALDAEIAKENEDG